MAAGATEEAKLDVSESHLEISGDDFVRASLSEARSHPNNSRIDTGRLLSFRSTRCGFSLRWDPLKLWLGASA